MVKKKLQSGELTIGTWITLGHPAVAEIFVNAGFDWLVVDLEHSSISIAQACDLIRVIELGGACPLVRLTSNDPDQVKRVMDAGAHGIVVPMVNSSKDAIQAVASTRYAPQGMRGVGLSRAQGYGVRFQEYMAWQKEGPLVIVQIEHKNAVGNLADILAVHGVDGFIIGPYDLSCSMGIPGDFNHPDYLEAIEIIRKTGHRMECPGGLHIVEPDRNHLKKAIDDGYRFIAYSVDIRMLDKTARDGIGLLKGENR